jgi:hypothetical protein
LDASSALPFLCYYRPHASEEVQGSGPVVVFVTVAEPVESPRVVTDYHRVHAFGHGHLPSIILAQPLGGAALA